MQNQTHTAVITRETANIPEPQTNSTHDPSTASNSEVLSLTLTRPPARIQRTIRQAEGTLHVEWAGDTVDNENANRKSSKSTLPLLYCRVHAIKSVNLYLYPYILSLQSVVSSKRSADGMKVVMRAIGRTNSEKAVIQRRSLAAITITMIETIHLQLA
jgi:hypothetical protein